jgi:23S rRNA (adenine2503-C2)-methyltransferase
VNSILSHTPEELRGAFREQGIEPFRASQVARWVFVRTIRDFDDMTDLSLELRRRLSDG